MEAIRRIERLRCQEMKLLTFGSSRKFGLRRKRAVSAPFWIGERVGVAGPDHSPAVLRPAE